MFNKTLVITGTHRQYNYFIKKSGLNPNDYRYCDINSSKEAWPIHIYGYRGKAFIWDDGLLGGEGTIDRLNRIRTFFRLPKQSDCEGCDFRLKCLTGNNMKSFCYIFKS